jgi:hypothetical protein
MTEMSLCTHVKSGTKLAMAAKHSLQRSLRESDLKGWSLRERILAVLDSCQEQTPPGKRDRHGLRTPERRSYLGLYLVGLFNPVVASMRGLCAAKHLPRVRTLLGRETPWVPSRFSDAQGWTSYEERAAGSSGSGRSWRAQLQNEEKPEARREK